MPSAAVAAVGSDTVAAVRARRSGSEASEGSGTPGGVPARSPAGAESEPSVVVVAVDGSSDGGEQEGDCTAAGLSVLRDLKHYGATRLRRETLQLAFGRLLVTVSAAPLAWQYPQQRLLAMLPWIAWATLPMAADVCELRCGLQSAAGQLASWPAAVAAAPAALARAKKELWGIALSLPVFVAVYWFAIAAPSAAPPWLQALATAALMASALGLPCCWRAMCCWTIVLRLVKEVTARVRDGITADSDVDQLGEQLAQLGALYDSARGCALVSVVDLAATAAATIGIVFPTVLLPSPNGMFVLALVAGVLAAMTTLLPSAEGMAILQQLPEVMSRRIIFAPACSPHRRQHVLQLLAAMDKARYGFYLFGVPLTSLIARFRTVVTPLLAVGLRLLLA